MKIKNQQLLLIEWVDSRGAGPRWHYASEIADDKLCKMQSVGWVIKHSKEEICIAPHLGLEDDGDHQVCGEMHIPMVCIIKIKKLN